jgi:hypothetical protein
LLKTSGGRHSTQGTRVNQRFVLGVGSNIEMWYQLPFDQYQSAVELSYGSWYRRYGIDSRSTNQNYRKSHRPTPKSPTGIRSLSKQTLDFEVIVVPGYDDNQFKFERTFGSFSAMPYHSGGERDGGAGDARPRDSDGIYCSPRHMMPFNSSIEGSTCVSLMWREISRERERERERRFRVCNKEAPGFRPGPRDDVAGKICQAVP